MTQHSLDDLKEQLAAIEHERWADWQRYVHSKLVTTDNHDRWYHLRRLWFNRWQRQIDTPYSELTEKEKASDMEQVDRYWPLIEQYIDNRIAEELDVGEVKSIWNKP